MFPRISPRFLKVLFSGLAGTLLVPTVHAANPILFVTQVPMPTEVNSRTASQSVMNVSSAFGNHLGATAACGRGGALLILYPGVAQPRDLTAAANFGTASTLPAQRAIAVRQPNVHWDGTRALFSMVVGAPTSAADPAQFFWQIHEVTNFANGQSPVITRVPGQPANANNVSPTYGTDDHVIFTSDLPRDAAAHLYPQRDEYLLLPTVTGLWTLDPVTGMMAQLQHSPSGAFSPFVDSFGRIVYTRWDHLSRDPQAVTDRGPGAGDAFAQTNNGTFNYLDETAHAPSAAELGTRLENFPEPRNFDHSGLAGTNLNGNAFNQFFPWMLTEDGTGEETLNHVGRHELSPQIDPSFTNDPKLVTMTAATRPAPGSTRSLSNSNFFQIHEDPLNPGTYYGINAPDVGYHAAGQVVKIVGTPATSPAVMQVTYVTAVVNVPAQPASPPVAKDIYHAAAPFQDGRLVVVHTSATAADANAGTTTNPTSAYAFRLKTLTGSVGTMTPNAANLTPGVTANVSYYTPAGLTSFNGTMWELDPAEVVARPRPARVPPGGLSPGSPPANGVTDVENQVFAEEGVDVPTFQSFLRRSRLALVVSRNVTTRDAADRQQPFNLKVTGSPTATAQTLGTGFVAGDKVYGVGVMQFLQADARRGLTNGTAAPIPGRRVLATPMHDVPGAERPVSENPPALGGAPAGSVAIADDGSMASFVPGGRAVTYHLLDAAPSFASQVKERYWLTFAAGEIRTCTSCHGINGRDQAGNVPPTNKPNALRVLLQNWKANHPPGAAQCAANALTVAKSAPTIAINVARVGGDTGTVSVNFSTADGTAQVGQDYAAMSGTLTWADGDSAPKTVSVALLHNPVLAADKLFTVTLTGGSPAPGSPASTSVTIQEPPFARWQLQRFDVAGANDPSIAGPNADPDGDGVVNLLEYALNHDPKLPDGAPLAAFPELDPTDGKTYLSLIFHRRLPPRDVSYHVEASPDLATWSEGPTAVQLFPATDDGNGITESVKARAVVPLGPNSRQFLRLRVTQP